MQEKRIYQAGLLDHWITATKPSYTINDYGEQVEGALTTHRIRANRKEIDNNDNKEVESGKMIIAQGRVDYMIRYKSWLNEEWAISDDATGGGLELLSVAIVGRKESMVLRCRKKDNI